MIEIVDLTATETHPLRRSVLRDGTTSDVVEFAGDDEPTTFHLGIRVDDDIVAVSTWLLHRYPDLPAPRAVQLRGMATTPERRGTGLGTRLLIAGIGRCVDRGIELVWARARLTACGFYGRHGFECVGPTYVDPTTGLEHRDIVRDLTT